MLLKKIGEFRYFILPLLLAAIGVGCYVVVSIYYLSSPRSVLVEIPKGSGLRDVARILRDEGAIRDDRVFVVYALLKNARSKLKAGEYAFDAGSNMASILDKIVQGKVYLRRITVPEGLTVKQIAKLLDEEGVVKKEEFLEAAEDKEFIQKLLGSSASSFEGYLFPNTYVYPKGISARGLITLMVEEHKKVFTSLGSSRIGLSPHSIVTIASIIEKETALPEEKPLVSAVLHNRLKLGMRLECDPTVIYALGEDFNGTLTKKDLKVESNYNTYLVHGLPPGPIANPGMDALKAAINPPDVPYLYFVSRGDGTHKFSTTYTDHLRAVLKYRKQKN
ncbi:MAG: endolytic transglycosylase MltG [Candidatus Caldarchaeum sp.]